MKLTKAQLKDRDRITAWLQGVPFRENSRDKHPTVPDLDREAVVAQYVPPDIGGAGQHYTPLEMAVAALGVLVPFPGCRILDPCAGIGNLLHALDWVADYGVEVVACDIEEEATQIGRRLYPWVDWRWANAFDLWDEFAGAFDCVIMNPPFGIQRGLYTAEQCSQLGAKRSEVLFLELAAHALKMDGKGLFILPGQGERRPHFLERLPQKQAAFFAERFVVEHVQQRLPGAFRFTNFQVEALFVHRTDYAVAPPASTAVAATPEPAPAAFTLAQRDPETLRAYLNAPALPAPVDSSPAPAPAPLPAPAPAAPVSALEAWLNQPVLWRASPEASVTREGWVKAINRQGDLFIATPGYRGESLVRVPVTQAQLAQYAV